MLTQEQKIQLEPLTKHERYGQLLIDAMKTWETAIPKQVTYGVTRWIENDEIDTLAANYTLDPTDNYCCCLIGGALVGKCSDYDITHTIMKSYNLSRSEVGLLINGFDSKITGNESYNKTYQFGKSVNVILFAKTETK